MAVEATGLSSVSSSTFFVRGCEHQGARPRPWRYWVKGLVAVDSDSQRVVAQRARQGPVNDYVHLPAVVDEAGGRVLAEAECDRERKHRHIRNFVGADRVIPAQRGKKTCNLKGLRKQRRENFPVEKYRP